MCPLITIEPKDQLVIKCYECGFEFIVSEDIIEYNKGMNYTCPNCNTKFTMTFH